MTPNRKVVTRLPSVLSVPLQELKAQRDKIIFEVCDYFSQYFFLLFLDSASLPNTFFRLCRTHQKLRNGEPAEVQDQLPRFKGSLTDFFLLWLILIWI